MNSKRFQRKIENFICENCRANVKGSGYTNHCPKCLWSKHVDINPGDRLADCGGMMKPVHVDFEKGKHVLTHKCIVCGFKKRNSTQKEDDFEMIIKLVDIVTEKE